MNRITGSRTGFAVLLACSLPAFTAMAAPSQEAAPLPSVVISDEALATENIHTAVARAGALPHHLDVPAYVVADDRRVARIRPVGSGRVLDVAVVAGQLVTRGQPLLTYENFTLNDETQQRLSAEAALQEARARRENAHQLYERARSLRGGAVSVGELERRASALREADALVHGREAVLRTMSEHLRRYQSNMERPEGGQSVVVSPIDGVVASINVAAGQEMTASGLPPVEIENLSRVWIVSQIDESDATRIRPGDRQLTWLASGEASIASHVDMIEGHVDPKTQHILARSLVENAKRHLRPGMLVRTRLFSSDKVEGILIPSTALQTLDGMPCVFVQTAPHRYTARLVQTGPSLEGQTVITSGLQNGETVVTQGSFTLKSQAILAPSAEANG
ncbi:efflux RND transporter periplasmic adaptor subunit [Acetobacter conturbans]|uniref:Efflux RND transporter periplasmic adaptor subunit n=1 Tax=Acetobacter conturbans TaxID=1737472 RepID=A0ABX0K239_9PROT|nr:efflux RND transporter periplasmic adaptor subunit [Acetobacter conturbans]NHN88768.1 efflux RND transporter periplasmic adaptor subunit [Acetobacter conturbans]